MMSAVKANGRWASTFARFKPGRLVLVGPIAVQVADWSQPRPGRAPMFTAGILERLSVAHPLLPLSIYAPAGIWLLWRALGNGLTAAAVLVAYVCGLAAWTLLEYVAHRGSFHHVPRTEAQVAYGYIVHGIHHAYPDDSRRWVMPPIVTVPIALAFFVLFTIALGRYGRPSYAGFIHGYLTYDLLHYFIHRGRMPTRLGRFLRQYHLAHHYLAPDRHFGVSSPLWDLVFGTR